MWAYETYLSSYPNGRHAAVTKRSLEVIRAREDDAAFVRAKAEGTVESYASYLEAYPSGRHMMEADRLRSEARRRAQAAREAEHEACPEIVSTYRKSMRDVSECDYEHTLHDYLISRTKFEDHWFVKWDNFKHEMMLKNALSGDIERRADWIGGPSCYLGTEHLSGSKVRIFYFGGSAGTSDIVNQLSFVEYNTDTRKFDNNVGLAISASCNIWIYNCHDNRNSTSCRGAESWYEESGLEEAELRVQAAREAAEARLKEEARSKEEALGLTHAQRVLVQRGLAAFWDDDEGVADGLFDEGTREMITEYQSLYGVTETGYLTRGQFESLMALGEEAEAADRERTPEVGERFRDCAECPELVVVPAGDFMMGSLSWKTGREDPEGPVHRVTVGEQFAVGVYEVTRKEWSRFEEETSYSMEKGCWIIEGSKWAMNQERHWRNPGFSQDDAHPVVCVNWEDAQAYVQWLSGMTGSRYRLLSESEWEYVTRAGTSSRYWWGDEVGRSRANCAGIPGCGSRWGGRQTAPVGSFLSNAFGLYDVHGNVSEWVEDCLHENYMGAPADGSAWTTGGDCSYRVTRGGSCFNPPTNIRSASRGGDPLKARSYNVGFRVAKVLE